MDLMPLALASTEIGAVKEFDWHVFLRAQIWKIGENVASTVSDDKELYDQVMGTEGFVIFVSDFTATRRPQIYRCN